MHEIPWSHKSDRRTAVTSVFCDNNCIKPRGLEVNGICERIGSVKDGLVRAHDYETAWRLKREDSIESGTVS